MPFVEINGNAGGTAFWHNGPGLLNVGTIWFVTVTLILAGIPH